MRSSRSFLPGDQYFTLTEAYPLDGGSPRIFIDDLLCTMEQAGIYEKMSEGEVIRCSVTGINGLFSVSGIQVTPETAQKIRSGVDPHEFTGVSRPFLVVKKMGQK